MKRILLSLIALVVLALPAQEPKIPPCDPVRIAIMPGTNCIVITAWVVRPECCHTYTLYLDQNSCSCIGGWVRLRTNQLALCTSPTVVFIEDTKLPFALYRVQQ